MPHVFDPDHDAFFQSNKIATFLMTKYFLNRTTMIFNSILNVSYKVFFHVNLPNQPPDKMGDLNLNLQVFYFKKIRIFPELREYLNTNKKK